MRVLVCGGRNFADRKWLSSVLTAVRQKHGIDAIIHGGARGADALAADYAGAWGLPVQAFPADWDKHGRAAGPIRNRQMLTEGKPDVVIAFPGGKGTADMTDAALDAGVTVWWPTSAGRLIRRSLPTPTPDDGE